MNQRRKPGSTCKRSLSPFLSFLWARHEETASQLHQPLLPCPSTRHRCRQNRLHLFPVRRPQFDQSMQKRPFRLRRRLYTSLRQSWRNLPKCLRRTRRLIQQQKLIKMRPQFLNTNHCPKTKPPLKKRSAQIKLLQRLRKQQAIKPSRRWKKAAMPQLRLPRRRVHHNLHQRVPQK